MNVDVFVNALVDSLTERCKEATAAATPNAVMLTMLNAITDARDAAIAAAGDDDQERY